MKCPLCGYLSFDQLVCCKQCGADMYPAAADVVRKAPCLFNAEIAEDIFSLRMETDPGKEAPEGKSRAGAPPLPGNDAGNAPALLERRLTEIEEVAARIEVDEAEPPPEEDAGPDFSFDEDLIPPALPGVQSENVARETGNRGAFNPEQGGINGLRKGGGEERPAAMLPRPGPIIDQDEEVPDQFWTREGAGLGRRIAALAFDQALLACILGLFFGGAYLSFRLTGFDTSLFLSPPGLLAALLPFFLLALLLNLGYFTFFHGWQGRTPGKGLAQIEIRVLDGSKPSYRRALLRWLGGLVSLACAGTGFVWAIFEPRRRSWADLLSQTVLSNRPHRASGPAVVDGLAKSPK